MTELWCSTELYADCRDPFTIWTGKTRCGQVEISVDG